MSTSFSNGLLPSISFTSDSHQLKHIKGMSASLLLVVYLVGLCAKARYPQGGPDPELCGKHVVPYLIQRAWGKRIV